MSASKLNNSPYQMPSRRNCRWIVFFAVIVTLIYWHGTFWTPSNPTFDIKLVKSTYDWSKWRPYHPITSMQSLPSEKPHRLPRIQHRPSKPPKFDVATQEKRRAFVKKTLKKAWKGYKKFAWMHDELAPVTAGSKDPFGGWAASAVDALDTLWIMDMKNEFYETARAVVAIDWSKTESTSCNVFETTIRHLGGLLSAYELSHLPALLDKAIELGNMLYTAFDTPNHMPPFWLDYQRAKTGTLEADYLQASASATSLSLEFTRLAQLTANPRYYDAIARVTDRLHENQNLTLLPGMWPTHFDLRNSIFTTDNSFSLGGLSDSMYEYVMKMQLMLGGTEPKYEQMYRTAAETIIQKLLFRPMTPENHDILFTGTGTVLQGVFRLDTEGQHLGCFAGGMFAIGGKLFNIPEHVDIGTRLTKGCIWAYDAFPSGVMPELFKLVPCRSLKGCEWDEKRWRSNASEDLTFGYPPKGFADARDPRYILRPEALESVYILYRITGDEEYREAAWRMFKNIVRVTDTEYGNSAISDVRSVKPRKMDSQESFWFSETLKYAYLTFSPPDFISLDDYVFNTEAHPLRIPKR